MTRQSILDAGKTLSWAGATPLLGAFGCPRNRGVAPARGTECAFLLDRVLPASREADNSQGGRICRSSTNDRNSLRESTSWRTLSSRPSGRTQCQHKEHSIL